MKILALVSSFRKKGNTARIVQMIASEMDAVAARHDEPLEFEILYLAHRDIKMCRGCRICFDRGEDHCPLKDDVPAIKAKLDAADAFIFASPVYVDDVNGVAKNWIDRMAYLCHRPGLAGKCTYLIATVADSPTQHTLRTMSMAVRTWGVHIVGQTGFKMGALMPQAEVERRYRTETAKVAQAFFHAIAEKRFLQPSFLSLMIFRIQQISWQKAVERETLDYAYWADQGWFDADSTFYIEHQAHPVKVALARLVGAVVARFVA